MTAYDSIIKLINLKFSTINTGSETNNIFLKNTDMQIINSDFIDSKGLSTIQANNSKLILDNTIFSKQNFIIGVIQAFENSNVEILNSQIKNSSSPSAILTNNSNIKIRNSFFSNNKFKSIVKSYGISVVEFPNDFKKYFDGN